MEKWSKIDGFSHYLVSDKGRVMSKPWEDGRRRKTACILDGTAHDFGYLKVCLVGDDGVKKNVFIHRLVALAFLPNPEGKRCINHIDNNPKNNNLENLEWCTHKENTAWMLKCGRAKRTESWLNNLNKGLDIMRKPVVGTNISTGEEIRFDGLNEVKRSGFQPSCVCNCCKGKQAYHKGYSWRYEGEEDEKHRSA